MPLTKAQIATIQQTIEDNIKEKLWQAFLLHRSTRKPQRLKEYFDHWFNRNEALQEFIVSLQHQFISSNLSVRDIGIGVTEYFREFSSIVPDFIHQMEQTSDTAVADLEEVFKSLQLSEEESAHGLEFAVETIEDSKERLTQYNVRTHTSEERLLRRMDSLARLLSLSPESSVCTAVTIYNRRLFISSNVSGDIPQDTMRGYFKAKLNVLREFMLNLHREQVTIYNPIIKSKIRHCVQNLIKIGGTSKSVPLLEQALFKLIDALQPRYARPGSINYFSENERDAILYTENITTLLTYKQRWNGQKKLLIGASVATEIISDLSHKSRLEEEHLQFPIAKALQNLKLKDFHAEQLIAYYLQNYLDVDLNDPSGEKIRIGITKLCCKTCFDTLSRFANIMVRGTHNVCYTDVADLFLNTSVGPVSTPQKRITDPAQSPGDTPFFEKNSPGLPISSPPTSAPLNVKKRQHKVSLVPSKLSRVPEEIGSPNKKSKLEVINEDSPPKLAAPTLLERLGSTSYVPQQSPLQIKKREGKSNMGHHPYEKDDEGKQARILKHSPSTPIGAWSLFSPKKKEQERQKKQRGERISKSAYNS